MDPRELGKSLAQRGKRPGGGLRLPVVLGKHFRRLKWCIEQPVRVTRLEPDDARIRAREAYIYSQRKGRSLDYGKHWGRPPTGNVSSANWKRSRPSPRSLALGFRVSFQERALGCRRPLDHDARTPHEMPRGPQAPPPPTPT